ncbi:(Na+)-NQR maturation NqrM [Aestuariirhabdus litorea]|uniref:(Na+)-NQR maturation NqrM n=1 Tax=Aestuariirhabdus litorea TaxID=2528527 RepID=A0A3P3VQE6_9GAMM|nr:(Na+)-NQR maturation NqrM [Aestuariirhabdus litorea]RRJ84674.1 (Na+)-NQR maturation NqrM [Aestuariirhabdus litorea]RWW97897.1 (Na+)-NQR maturation NqrM [Endozoicomonadaceae bacterium GTF-13]
MMIFVLTFVALLVIVTAMALGVIFANKPIKGSCGGLGAVGIESTCEICGGDPNKCEEEQVSSESAGSEDKGKFYDAAK